MSSKVFVCVEANKGNKLWLLYFQVSLAAADNLYEEAMQSKAKMKNEILDLKYHLHTLRDSVRELEIMLSDGEMHCDAIKQVSQSLH